MSDAREDNLLTTDAGGSGTGDALTPEGAGRRPQQHQEGADDGTQEGLLTDPQTTGAAPENTDPGRSGADEQTDDSAGSGRDA
jgi:hypothetical protein